MGNFAQGGLRLFFLPACLVLSIALLAAACSSGGDGEGETPADGADDTEPLEFDVSMSDSTEGGTLSNFFEPNEFTASPGQQVTFNLSNDGTTIHNMRVDGGDGEYNTGDDTVSEPALFQPGESATLVWTAPDSPGTISFQCDFHPTDMTGTITVE